MVGTGSSSSSTTACSSSSNSRHLAAHPSRSGDHVPKIVQAAGRPPRELQRPRPQTRNQAPLATFLLLDSSPPCSLFPVRESRSLIYGFTPSFGERAPSRDRHRRNH